MLENTPCRNEITMFLNKGKRENGLNRKKSYNSSKKFNADGMKGKCSFSIGEIRKYCMVWVFDFLTD
jgi:hypothetical protein